MRVMTMNLWGTRGDWAKRRDVLARGIGDLAPDLVAFQEVIRTRSYDQAADLLGPRYHLAHSEAREPDGQGIAIGSRWPFDGVREADLDLTPRTAGFACTTLGAQVMAPDPAGPLLLVNHFPSWRLDMEYERELQAVASARLIETMLDGRDMHVVLAGDLDAAPDAASVQFWTGRRSLQNTSVCYRDAWDRVHPGEPGVTYTPDNPLMEDGDWPFRRIDYVLVRCGLHGGPTLPIDDCRRVFVHPVGGVQASDHYGLTADLGDR
ncbi:endonuclease/exonuclease/phosphatase family protein [Actinomadura madurae]|uniref:endonuclease/exonuclease/phosphatase family protein n=1 Tax=Actinomadura madurae TaxID=1993 RepID=UPI0020D20A12|nr:endonuclease/exonuclease/phosphatase family protein [Actinomadura madurae]MCP9984516.1 endonuclease/exonuclease/phosphatase family protein [Actinomadura madurae]